MVKSCEEKQIVVLVEPDDALFPKYHSMAETLRKDGATEELLRKMTFNFLEDFPEYSTYISEHWAGTAVFAIRPLSIGIILACMEKEEESKEELLNRIKENIPDSVSELKDHAEKSDNDEYTENDLAVALGETPEEKGPVLTVFHFSDLEWMIRGISQTRELSGDVYEDQDGFLLPVFIITQTDAQECLRLSDFTDYNQVEDKAYLLHLKEHKEKLCTVDDIRKLDRWKGKASC